jgi:hypothetical protein
MKYFDLIQTSLFNIRNIIAGNESIQKLVAYDQPDALSQNAPSAAQYDPKISVTAIFDITEPPYDYTTFITVVATKIQADEDEQIFSAVVRVNIITQAQL